MLKRQTLLTILYIDLAIHCSLERRRTQELDELDSMLASIACYADKSSNNGKLKNRKLLGLSNGNHFGMGVYNS